MLEYLLKTFRFAGLTILSHLIAVYQMIYECLYPLPGLTFDTINKIGDTHHCEYSIGEAKYCVVSRHGPLKKLPPVPTSNKRNNPIILSAATSSGRDITSVVLRYAGPDRDFHAGIGYPAHREDVSPDESITITDMNFCTHFFLNPDSVLHLS